MAKTDTPKTSLNRPPLNFSYWGVTDLIPDSIICGVLLLWRYTLNRMQVSYISGLPPHFGRHIKGRVCQKWARALIHIK